MTYFVGIMEALKMAKNISEEKVSQRNATHILSYIMKIDQSIINGEYPNVNKLNKKYGWNLSRSTIGRYIEILKNS